MRRDFVDTNCFFLWRTIFKRRTRSREILGNVTCTRSDALLRRSERKGLSVGIRRLRLPVSRQEANVKPYKTLRSHKGTSPAMSHQEVYSRFSPAPSPGLQRPAASDIDDCDTRFKDHVASSSSPRHSLRHRNLDDLVLDALKALQRNGLDHGTRKPPSAPRHVRCCTPVAQAASPPRL